MATYRVSATDAVRQFSELVRRVGDGGQEIVIERHRKPVVRISQVGFSPVRWCDFDRHVRRTRQPDSNFMTDLVRSRGQARRRTGPESEALPLTGGTVLLDSTLLVGVFVHRHPVQRLQRVATTAAAMAELAHVAESRGDSIAEVRLLFLRRVAAALPVLSLTHEASLSRLPGEHKTTRHGVFLELAERTAMSVGWPLVGPTGLLSGLLDAAA